jgi:nucleotide-binding universal stress UspA family protein
VSAYRRILVAVDGSATSMKGLREAIRLAKDDRAQLFLVHVVNEFYAFASLDGYSPGVDLVPALREGGRRILAKALADREGIRAKTLMRETLGSDAEQVVRRSPVPVLLVRA